MKRYTDAEWERIGQNIGVIFNIPKDRSGKFKTTWGTKTGLGLIKTLERILDDIKKGRSLPM